MNRSQALRCIAHISKGGSLGRSLESSYSQHVGECTGRLVALMKYRFGGRSNILIALNTKSSQGTLWLLNQLNVSWLCNANQFAKEMKLSRQSRGMGEM